MLYPGRNYSCEEVQWSRLLLKSLSQGHLASWLAECLSVLAEFIKLTETEVTCC